MDYADPDAPLDLPGSDVLQGCPGAAGRVSGIVRVLQSPNDAAELRAGEVLVTATTNVG